MMGEGRKSDGRQQALKKNFRPRPPWGWLLILGLLAAVAAVAAGLWLRG